VGFDHVGNDWYLVVNREVDPEHPEFVSGAFVVVARFFLSGTTDGKSVTTPVKAYLNSFVTRLKITPPGDMSISSAAPGSCEAFD
jgi:hypothetical protein